MAPRSIVVLPRLIDSVDIPPFLRDKVYADFTTPEKFEETFSQLLKALGISVKGIKLPVGRVEVPEAPKVLTAAARRLAHFVSLISKTFVLLVLTIIDL